jgi:putative ABC transport system permease protein
MGLSRRTHLGSLLLELGALTGWAWLVGALIGVLALLIVTRSIEVDPGYRPPTLLRLPTVTTWGTAAGLAVVAAALALWTQRLAHRTDPATVMRA